MSATKLTHLARLLAACVAGLSLWVLAGYLLDRAGAISLRADWPGMSPLTAIALLALAVGVMAAADGHLPRLKQFGASAAMLAVAGPLASRLIDGTDRVSPWLTAPMTHLPPTAWGSVSVGTAITVLMLGTGLIVRRHRPGWADLLGGAALLVSGITMLGYLYDVQEIVVLPVFRNFALHTAIGLFVTAVASLVVDPDSLWIRVATAASAGGRATRRGLAFTFAVPVLGLAFVQAVRTGRLGYAAAMALFVGLVVTPLALLVLRDGLLQWRLDRARAAADQREELHTRELESSLAEQAARIEAQAAEREKTEQALHKSQRLEAVGQLTGGIAHDFNNLLMVISGNLQLMQRRLDPEHPVFKHLQKAADATARGAKVTGQLLAFSRTQRLKIEPFSVTQAVANAGMLMTSALGSMLRVTVDPSATDRWAMGNADQCELALMNLAVNARDAMPGGQGELRLAVDAWEETDPAAADPRRYVRIQVTDNGAGMTAEVLARAVEPFFTTKERGKGTGLGLAQAYGFARQSQGDLRIASTPGAGTTVDILLPAAQAPKTAASHLATDATAPPLAATAHRVLVIDDDDRVRDVIVAGLSASGFEVREAATGQAGLDQLDHYQPDVAVIDFAMPGLNGAETAKLARLRHATLPIVFVTGYSDTLALDGISDATVLRKPFDIDRLQQAVLELIT